MSLLLSLSSLASARSYPIIIVFNLLLVLLLLLLFGWRISFHITQSGIVKRFYMIHVIYHTNVIGVAAWSVFTTKIVIITSFENVPWDTPFTSPVHS